MKIRILKESKLLKEAKIITSLNNFPYDLGQSLGKGKIGEVFEAKDQEGGEWAVKAINNDKGQGSKEIYLYLMINYARNNPLIGKHFPYVDAVFDDKENNMSYIVMEKLTSKGAKAMRIGDLFPGIEGHTGNSPLVDLDGHVDKTLKRRVYELLNSERSRDHLIEEMIFGSAGANTGLKKSTLKKIIQTNFARMTYLNYAPIKDTKTSKVHKYFVDKIFDLPITADSKLTLINASDGEYTNLKKEYLEVPGAVAFIFKVIDSAKLYPGATMDADHMIKTFSDVIRKRSPMGIHGNTGTSDYNKMWYGLDKDVSKDTFSEVGSMYEALEALKKETGLVGRDMHEGNVLVRASTGDLVIVDVFKDKSKVNESKIRIKILKEGIGGRHLVDPESSEVYKELKKLWNKQFKEKIQRINRHRPTSPFKTGPRRIRKWKNLKEIFIDNLNSNISPEELKYKFKSSYKIGTSYHRKILEDLYFELFNEEII